jgi:hypothetical protein
MCPKLHGRDQIAIKTDDHDKSALLHTYHARSCIKLKRRPVDICNIGRQVHNEIQFMWFFREAFPKRFKPSTLRDRNTALKITKNCQLWSRNARQIFLRILQRKQGNWGSKCFSLLLVGPNRRPIGCTKKSPC